MFRLAGKFSGDTEPTSTLPYRRCPPELLRFSLAEGIPPGDPDAPIQDILRQHLKDYPDAFRNYTDKERAILLTDERRALLEAVGPEGKAMVDFICPPEIERPKAAEPKKHKSLKFLARLGIGS